MKNYQHWSTEALESKKANLYSDIGQWESLLTKTRSFLIQLSLSNYIKRAQEHIRAIDAELCYREHNG